MMNSVSNVILVVEPYLWQKRGKHDKRWDIKLVYKIILYVWWKCWNFYWLWNWYMWHWLIYISLTFFYYGVVISTDNDFISYVNIWSWSDIDENERGIGVLFWVIYENVIRMYILN